MNPVSFVLRRLLSVIPLLFLLPLLTFLLMHSVPGNYFDVLRMNPQIAPDIIRHYEQMYRLDQPALIQYLHWLKNIVRLDFGYSFAYQQPVFPLLMSRLGNTLALTGISFLLAWLLAAGLGLWAGTHRRGWIDRTGRFAAYAALSIPNFFLCLLLLWAASMWTGLPLGGTRSAGYEFLSWHGKIADRFYHLLIPALVLTLGSFAFLFRIMRSQAAAVSSQDFVFYLRSLHLPERRIIFKHVGRNAVNPMISLFGLELPALFSGAALVEIFTGWPGLGSMMLQAVRTQDLYLVLGNMLIVAFLLVAGNLAADLMLVAVDPRIRLSGART